MNLKNFNYPHTLAISIIGACTLLTACFPDNEGNEKATIYRVNQMTQDVMKEFYLWYDEVPTVDPTDYDDPQEYLNQLTYKQYDKWSFIISHKEFNDYFEKGEFAGHGFQLSIDVNNQFWIAFVFKNSDLYPQGVRRGWRIDKINGSAVTLENYDQLMGADEVGVSNVFTFQLPNGSTQDITSTKKPIAINAVLQYDTLHVANKIVGHLVYQTFIEPSIPELEEAFSFFQQTNVSELILDLRYNGGGDMVPETFLANCIGGLNFNGQKYHTLKHNDSFSGWDTTVYLQANDFSINLDPKRFFVITSKNTASASESVISGLNPYMEAILIGDNTHGKPVGMEGISYQQIDRKVADYLLFAISFKIINSVNESDYFDGLPVDKVVSDDLIHDFGDRNEAALKEAISYIETGHFSTTSVKKDGRPQPYLPLKGFQQIRQAY